jgi:GTPase
LFDNDHDTIFALASGAGRAAIAVLRLSGPGCSEALKTIAPGAEFPDRRAVLRTLKHPQSREPLDRALITRFQAPRSFTGEEMAEISVTGGRAVAAACVKALALIPRLRLAEPGEFAWRAFMNGKIDLAEVEGLADLVEAETEAQRRQAQNIAGGALSRACDAIRTSLLEAMAAVETQIDFTDVEDASDLTLDTVRGAAHGAIERIDKALATADSAQRLRDGFTVVIAGPPNVGKSTLMNALIGQKISITSRKAQTTRHRITGIRTEPEAQFIFVDTPGFQTQHATALNRSLNRAVTSTLSSVDVVMFVVEAGRFSADDEKVLKLLPTNAVVLLIANKVDRVGDKGDLLPFVQEVSQVREFNEIVPMSAKKPEDIVHLLKTLLPHLPEGDPIYGEDDLTDRSERFLAAEILREKVFRWTGDELPYTSTVLIEKFEQEGRLRRIFATIMVDRDGHKAMIIGQKGAKLKQINTDARLDMEKLFDGPIYLEVFVKVKSGWADNEAGLRAYGYE